MAILGEGERYIERDRQTDRQRGGEKEMEHRDGLLFASFPRSDINCQSLRDENRD